MIVLLMQINNIHKGIYKKMYLQVQLQRQTNKVTAPRIQDLLKLIQDFFHEFFSFQDSRVIIN